MTPREKRSAAAEIAAILHQAFTRGYVEMRQNIEDRIAGILDAHDQDPRTAVRCCHCGDRIESHAASQVVVGKLLVAPLCRVCYRQAHEEN